MNNKNKTDEIDEAFHNLLFGVRKSIRYHNRRRRFFDSISKFTSIIAALSGSATIITVLAKAGNHWVISFATIVAIFSIIDLVVGTAESARNHNDFAKRFFDLEKSIITNKVYTDDILAELTSRRLDIEADEPPPLKVLDVICHNELVRALGYDDSELAQVTWCQRLFSQYFDLKEYKIKAPRRSPEE
ncbi:hypothetical protein ACFLZL_03025 [Thermodesulfobacteriota bacterium]